MLERLAMQAYSRALQLCESFKDKIVIAINILFIIYYYKNILVLHVLQVYIHVKKLAMNFENVAD